MARSRMVVTGASGFLGRHLVEALCREHEIVAVSRASPGSRGMALPAGVRWLYLDVADAPGLDEAMAQVRREGPVQVLIHLAGHYDFSGERHPEYQRTNVEGTRHVLRVARALGVSDVVFASSVAACRFPGPGQALSERSPADGETPYAESKRAGEALLAASRGDFRGWIVRFAALFSDWCEYEPMFRFIETWLSRQPRHRVLAGHGASAVPYLHVRDAVDFVGALLARRETLDCRETLLASSDGATSHRELFDAATATHFGERARPLLVPRSLCRAGLWLRHLAGRAFGAPAFERPWMGRFIDLQLRVDATRTRERLGWAPRPRLGICRRMPFLVQNRKAYPAEWLRRNHAALRRVRLHENLAIYRLLERHTRELAQGLAAYVMDPARRTRFAGLRGFGTEQQEAECALLIEALVDSVRTGDKGVFRGACQELGRRRRAEGFPLDELTSLLDGLNDLCTLALAGMDPGAAWSLALYDHVTMTIQFGVDEICDAYDEPS